MLDEHNRVGNLPIDDLEGAIEHCILVWRVQEHDAGLLDLVRGRLEPAHDVSTDDSSAGLEIEGFQVLAQDSKTTRLAVHERDSGCASRHGLDAERAGTCKKVEDVRIGDARSDQVEDRLLDHALRRADAFRRFEAAAACLPARNTKPWHCDQPTTRIEPSPLTLPILTAG